MIFFVYFNFLIMAWIELYSDVTCMQFDCHYDLINERYDRKKN